MNIDLAYIIAGVGILIALIIASTAQIKVNNAYSHFKEVDSSLNLTGAELAEKLAKDNNLNLTIKICKGKLTDHYNPKDKSLNISKENYEGKSISAHSIVAHEFGHALQDAKNYAPLKIRQFAIKISNFSSKMLIPLIIIGVLLQFFLVDKNVGSIIIYAVVGIYALSVLVSLITLPVEYNASSRAKKILQIYFNKEEMEGTQKVLNAAALTYVASLLVSLAYFIRFLLYMFMIFRKD